MTDRDTPSIHSPSIGPDCLAVTVHPDEVQLFRFSAVTWNAHRIHYDQSYARSEGYDDVLVQAHLHGAFLARAALDWAGDNARLTQLEWQNRAPAVAGDDLTITGTVTETRVVDGARHVAYALQEHNADGTLVVQGTARTVRPANADETDDDRRPDREGTGHGPR